MSLWIAVAVFAGGAAAIGYAGTKLTGLADLLADRTRLGEVFVGALFIGASTSLPGAVLSIATAAEGHPALAIGNALGGITVQTAFLALADLAYRGVNLEHAAATVTGLVQGVLLIVILALPLIASVQPPVTVWGVHPVSAVIVIVYAGGLRLLGSVRDTPMWRPVRTSQTRAEMSTPAASAAHMSTTALWLRFAAFAAAAGVAGFAVGQASIALVRITGMSETLFGTLFSAASTSIPELVIALAAVRIGAVNLAVGDILGGNAFDVLFLGAIDLVYPGSIYNRFVAADRTTVLIAIVMTGTIVLGLLKRERAGPGGIGFESVTVLGLYALSIVLLSFG